ncbi:MAG: hypothetical protein NVS4B11_31460 [Ktedonobacteraceae bacterium]
MVMACPQCAYSNPDQSAFCVRCGNNLFSSGQTGQFTSGFNNPPVFNASSSVNVPPPVYAQPPVGALNVPGMQPSSQNWPAPSSAPLYPTQMGTGQGMASIRRAFAGHGHLVMHFSWLLEGKYAQAVPARNAVMDMFHQRNASGLKAGPEKLMERGLLMEERDYITVQRGVSTVFVYVAPAGQDLYISRATTVLPVISYFRVAILALALITMLLGFISQGALTSPQSYSGYGSPGPAIGSIVAAGFLAFLAYCLFLGFIVLAIRSFVNWLVEKDFWFFLRPNYLNAFQLDDIALLEHTSDNIVRDAVKHLGLDATKITAPPQGYQPKQKIRGL